MTNGDAERNCSGKPIQVEHMPPSLQRLSQQKRRLRHRTPKRERCSRENADIISREALWSAAAKPPLSATAQ